MPVRCYVGGNLRAGGALIVEIIPWCGRTGPNDRYHCATGRMGHIRVMIARPLIV